MQNMYGIKPTTFPRYDFVALPGGFSYGDYLRAGAIARFSNIMQALVDFAKAGKPHFRGL